MISNLWRTAFSFHRILPPSILIQTFAVFYVSFCLTKASWCFQNNLVKSQMLQHSDTYSLWFDWKMQRVNLMGCWRCPSYTLRSPWSVWICRTCKSLRYAFLKTTPPLPRLLRLPSAALIGLQQQASNQTTRMRRLGALKIATDSRVDVAHCRTVICF